jgi:hypothetical protein
MSEGLPYVEDAVEPREDLRGHLGHIAVVEHAWLAVPRVLIVETAYSFNRVLEAWRLLSDTCVYCMRFCVLGFDDARCGLYVVNALVYTHHSVADAPPISPTSNVSFRCSHQPQPQHQPRVSLRARLHMP